MSTATAKRVSYDIGCMKSLRSLPDRVVKKFLDLMTKYMSDPSAGGLNLESVEGSRDEALKSLRVDQGYRAIAFEAGRDIMFVHVNEHDKAYRWASGRRVKLDASTNRVRIVEVLEEAQTVSPTTSETPPLFAGIADKRLIALGVTEEEIPAARTISSLDDLERREGHFDTMTFQVLYGLAAGYSDEEVYALTGIAQEETAQSPAETSFEDLISSEESRQTIFIPESQEDLRRFFEGELDGWRVFLHPEQRKLAYRDYNGPAMVRGGAGTGKTVVAMHRAKHLADQIKQDPQRDGERILVTTFTRSLAQDIEANLKTLCPEHLKDAPRIEVVNLDRWVSQFLKRKSFDRRIAFFGDDRAELDRIWEDVFIDHTLPEGLSEAFVRAEWAQIVQAQGLLDRSSYLRASRVGRGTPLDRRKRAQLWDIFSDYRARLISKNLAEPDDAYREAIEILKAEAPQLPYASVVIDEAQDMGEQAFRLVRAIVPESAGSDANSIFIVGDAHQRIYARRASMKACGINIRGRSRRLKLNYRTTQEIRSWAVAILEGITVDDLDEGVDSFAGYTSLMSGPAPKTIHHSNRAAELDGLACWIKRQVEQGGSVEEIGVLAVTNALADEVCQELGLRGINTLRLSATTGDDRTKPGVRVTTMHRAKGLEFFAVALPFLSEGEFPPKFALQNAVDAADLEDIHSQFRSLLHVAATRAKKALLVSWTGRPSSMFPESPQCD